jgi:hypothetical protein
MNQVLPTVGIWYQAATHETFEIVAYDAVSGLIEIQYFDGTVEELDLDTWNEQLFTTIEPPEDWSGSMDIERQDYGVDLDDSFTHSFDNPLDNIDER